MDYMKFVTDKYRFREINKAENLLYVGLNMLHEVITRADFVGYLYDDDIITTESVRYINKSGNDRIFILHFRPQDITVKRPTHVVLKK